MNSRSTRGNNREAGNRDAVSKLAWMRTQFVHATCDDSAPTTVAAERTVAHIALRLSDPVALQSVAESLCSKVTGRDFVVDNPYLFKTEDRGGRGPEDASKHAHLISVYLLLCTFDVQI